MHFFNAKVSVITSNLNWKMLHNESIKHVVFEHDRVPNAYMNNENEQ